MPDTKRSLVELKAFFETGDKPTQQQFADMLYTLFQAQAELPAIYEFNLTQEATDAPTAVEFANTLGAVTYGYLGVGSFTLTCVGAFPDDTKVHIVYGHEQNLGINWQVIDADTLQFDVYVNGTPANDGLLNTSVTIKVKP